MKRTLNLVAVRGQATAASLKARSRSSRGNKKAGMGRQGGDEDEQRDKDEQGDERSHLNATQWTTSKGASPPETREMKAMRVVLSDWLL